MEIKFHTKPTQINRNNPIVVVRKGFMHVYAYHLRDDFYVKFAIVGGTSFAGLIKTDDPKSIYTIIADNTIIDIHNKNQLVEFVTSYSKLSTTVLNDVYNQGIN